MVAVSSKVLKLKGIFSLLKWLIDFEKRLLKVTIPGVCSKREEKESDRRLSTWVKEKKT
jgi:hypothetical protein